MVWSVDSYANQQWTEKRLVFYGSLLVLYKPFPTILLGLHMTNGQKKTVQMISISSYEHVFTQKKHHISTDRGVHPQNLHGFSFGERGDPYRVISKWQDWCADEARSTRSTTTNPAFSRPWNGSGRSHAILAREYNHQVYPKWFRHHRCIDGAINIQNAVTRLVLSWNHWLVSYVSCTNFQD